MCLRNSHKSEENDIECNAKFKVITALTVDYHSFEIYAVQSGRSFTSFSENRAFSILGKI
jgi:hypothetical protein